LLTDYSTSTTFVKRDLKPFNVYAFRVIAATMYGRAASDWADIVTLQDRQ